MTSRPLGNIPHTSGKYRSTFPLALLAGGTDMYVSTFAIVSRLPRPSPLWIVPLRQQLPLGLARYASGPDLDSSRSEEINFDLDWDLCFDNNCPIVCCDRNEMEWVGGLVGTKTDKISSPINKSSQVDLYFKAFSIISRINLIFIGGLRHCLQVNRGLGEWRKRHGGRRVSTENCRGEMFMSPAGVQN